MKTQKIPGKNPQTYAWLKAGLLLVAVCLRRMRTLSRQGKLPSPRSGGTNNSGKGTEPAASGTNGGEGTKPAEKKGESLNPEKGAKKAGGVRKRSTRTTPRTPEEAERLRTLRQTRAERQAKLTAEMEQLLMQLAGLPQRAGAEREMTRLRRNRLEKAYPKLMVPPEVLSAADQAIDPTPLGEKIDAAVRAVLGAHHEADFVQGVELLETVFCWADRQMAKKVRVPIEAAADPQLELFTEEYGR